MTKPRARWPLGVTSEIAIQFAIAAVVVLVLLVVIDVPTAHWAATWPTWAQAPFRAVKPLGKSDWILIPALLVAVVGGLAARFVPLGRFKAAMVEIAGIGALFFFGVGLPGLASNLVKRLVGRARPVHLDDLGFAVFHPVINDWSFQSFPSGDTTTIIAFACVVFFVVPRLAIPAALVAIAVSLDRIVLGYHYPSDVYSGILLGAFGAYAVRNYCARRGWMFLATEGGKVARKPYAGLAGLFGITERGS